MKTLTLFGLFFSAALLASESDEMLVCHSKGKQWTARLSVTAAQGAQLELEKNGKSRRCGLSIRSFENQARAHGPFMEMRFERKTCTPELNDAEKKEILSKQFILVSLLDKKKPTAKTQWLTKEQTKDCAPLSFDQTSLSLYAEKFKSGTWGK